jgi:hypothetical protein
MMHVALVNERAGHDTYRFGKEVYNSSAAKRPAENRFARNCTTAPGDPSITAVGYFQIQSNIGCHIQSGDYCAEGSTSRNAGHVSTTATRLLECHDAS